jgi:hypothetical protein
VKVIHDTGSKRRFWANHGEVYGLCLRKCTECVHIISGQWHVVGFCDLRRASIAGRDVDMGHQGRLRQFPGKGVFTPRATDYQDFHWLNAGNGA